MRPPKSEALIEKVMANSHEHEGCLIWDGCVNSAGVPLCRHNGSNVMPVRRHLWAAMGRKLGNGRKSIIVTDCKNPLCVEPSHLIQVDRGADRIGVKHTLLARKHMSAAVRARSKLTFAEAVAIRESDEPRKVLAEKHGICLTQVRNILNQDNWADLDSPFWALQA